MICGRRYRQEPVPPGSSAAGPAPSIGSLSIERRLQRPGICTIERGATAPISASSPQLHKRSELNLFAGFQPTSPRHQEPSRCQSPPSLGRCCVVGTPPSCDELPTLCVRPPARCEQLLTTAESVVWVESCDTRDHLAKRTRRLSAPHPSTVAVHPASSPTTAKRARGHQRVCPAQQWVVVARKPNAAAYTRARMYVRRGRVLAEETRVVVIGCLVGGCAARWRGDGVDG